MGFSSDLVKGPVGMLIALVVWLITAPLLMGALNGWYTQSVPACTVDGERFERIVSSTQNDTNDAWAKVTSVVTGGTAAAFADNKAYTLGDDSGTCKAVATTALANGSLYTPSGTEVTATATGVIDGGAWSEPSAIFMAAGLGALIQLILQAAGLAPPVAILAVLGIFGSSFLRNLGGNPIILAIVTVVAFLMVATILNELVPFLTTAFSSIDANRFVMYDSGLGNVGIIIKRFYGVILVAGLIVVAWTVISAMRGSSSKMGMGSM